MAVILSMILVAGSVYGAAPLEKCCGIEITEHGISALISMFFGATAAGTANAAYKRLAASKAAGMAPPQALADAFQHVAGRGSPGAPGAPDVPSDLSDILGGADPPPAASDDEETPPGK